MRFCQHSKTIVSCGRPVLTRRELLQQVGWLAAAAALSLEARLAGQSPGPAISPVMARLSAYMSEARSRALPAEVIEKAKHHILDTIAAMISGAELPPGRAAIAFAREYRGAQVATVAGA